MKDVVKDGDKYRTEQGGKLKSGRYLEAGDTVRSGGKVVQEVRRVRRAVVDAREGELVFGDGLGLDSSYVIVESVEYKGGK